MGTKRDSKEQLGQKLNWKGGTFISKPALELNHIYSLCTGLAVPYPRAGEYDTGRHSE